MTLLSPAVCTALRTNISQTHNLDDLELLCRDLGVDPEDIRGKTNGKEYWISQIILYLDYRARIPDLIARLILTRNTVDWQKIVSAAAPAVTRTSGPPVTVQNERVWPTMLCSVASRVR